VASLAFLVEIFSDVRPKDRNAKKLTADELLRRGIARLRERKDKSDPARMMILWTVGSAATRAGMFDEASELLEEALDLARRDQPGQPVLGSVLASLGLLRQEQGRSVESVELLKESDAVFAAAQGTKSRNSIQARLNYAQSMRESGNPRRAADIARDALRETESSAEGRDKRLDLTVILGLSLYDLRETDEALTVLTAALAEHESEGPSAGLASLVHTLGLVLYVTDRYDEARERIQAALDMRLTLLDPEDDAIAASYNALSAIAKGKGEYGVALDWMSKAMEIQLKRYGAESPQVALYEFNRARILLLTDDLDAAEALARHSLDVRRESFGNDNLRVGDSEVLLGEIALKRQDTAAAESALTDAVRILDLRLGRPHPSTIQARFRLVQCFMAAQRAEEARSAMEELLGVARTSKQINASQRQSVLDLAQQVEKLAGGGSETHTHTAGDALSR
jgi:tetratricopeptide (TPR) repeat protein